jgi:hypothetical protein
VNNALQQARKIHQEQVRNGEITTAAKLNPTERAKRHPTSLRAAITAMNTTIATTIMNRNGYPKISCERIRSSMISASQGTGNGA